MQQKPGSQLGVVVPAIHDRDFHGAPAEEDAELIRPRSVQAGVRNQLMDCQVPDDQASPYQVPAVRREPG